MTPMQSIKRLKNIIVWNGERDDYIAVDVGVKALEKQIPKKPIKKDSYIYTSDYECPCCQARLITELDGKWVAGNKNRFCHACGQELDWGIEE